MDNVYIVRLKNQILICIYYIENKGIIKRQHTSNGWSEEEILVGFNITNFTISIDEESKIYIFCQNKNGDLMLIYNKMDGWITKLILKNNSQEVYNIKMTGMFNKQQISLMYNIKAEKENEHYIVKQNLREGGTWVQGEKIDKAFDFNNRMYSLQMLQKNHGVIFYHRRVIENEVGFREITFNKFGKWNLILKTGQQILDTSFLTTKEEIHCVYIIKNIRSSQLIYKKKTEAEFSNPLILWDAPRLDNCMIFIIKEVIYVTYINTSNVYIITSEDNGKNFTRPQRYKKKITPHLVKAKYISSFYTNEKNYCIRDLYVDLEKPWDIQIIPDIYVEFYNSKTIDEQSVKIKNEESNSTLKTNKLLEEELEKYKKEYVDLKEENIYLKKMIEKMKKQKFYE